VTLETTSRRSASPIRELPRAGRPAEAVLGQLRSRSLSVHARARVAEALYLLALDLVGDDGRLAPADRRWLVEAVATPVAEASQAALDALIDELALALSAAPPRVVPRSGASVQRIDFE